MDGLYLIVRGGYFGLGILVTTVELYSSSVGRKIDSMGNTGIPNIQSMYI